MDTTVTISVIEYDRLRAAAEMLSDLQAYDGVTAALARGEEDLIPAAFADRLLDGEAPLRVYRDFRGFSGQDLARRSGVNRVQIIEIEAGRKTGSVATLRKLADALRISLGDLA